VEDDEPEDVRVQRLNALMEAGDYRGAVEMALSLGAQAIEDRNHLLERHVREMRACTDALEEANGAIDWYKQGWVRAWGVALIGWGIAFALLVRGIQ
jgi:hypothetical protein